MLLILCFVSIYAQTELTNNLLQPATIDVLIKHMDQFPLNEIDSKRGELIQKFSEPRINAMFDEFMLGLQSGTTFKIWNYVINPSQANIKNLHIELKYVDNQVIFHGNSISATVSIPPIYSPKQVCTTKRKWYGKKKTKCHTEYVTRGLNQYEINIVSNHLQSAVDKSLATIAY